MLEINNLNGDHKILMTRSEWIAEASKSYIPLIRDEIKSCKCEYCGSMVDTTYINCPNCGAPTNRRRTNELRYEYNGIPVEFID